MISLPPKKEGICDKCGAPLIQRSDDSEETAKQRLNVYEAQTAPLIGYYEAKGVLVRTRSTNSSLEENYSRLEKALNL